MLTRNHYHPKHQGLTKYLFCPLLSSSFSLFLTISKLIHMKPFLLWVTLHHNTRIAFVQFECIMTLLLNSVLIKPLLCQTRRFGNSRKFSLLQSPRVQSPRAFFPFPLFSSSTATVLRGILPAPWITLPMSLPVQYPKDRTYCTNTTVLTLN